MTSKFRWINYQHGRVELIQSPPWIRVQTWSCQSLHEFRESSGSRNSYPIYRGAVEDFKIWSSEEDMSRHISTRDSGGNRTRVSELLTQ